MGQRNLYLNEICFMTLKKFAKATYPTASTQTDTPGSFGLVVTELIKLAESLAQRNEMIPARWLELQGVERRGTKTNHPAPTPAIQSGHRLFLIGSSP